MIAAQIPESNLPLNVSSAGSLVVATPDAIVLRNVHVDGATVEPLVGPFVRIGNVAASVQLHAVTQPFVSTVRMYDGQFAERLGQVGTAQHTLVGAPSCLLLPSAFHGSSHFVGAAQPRVPCTEHSVSRSFQQESPDVPTSAHSPHPNVWFLVSQALTGQADSKVHEPVTPSPAA